MCHRFGPFLTFWGLNTIYLGYFFALTNTKTTCLCTNPSRIRSFWPQIPFLPRCFRVQFSAACRTLPPIFWPSSPPTPHQALDYLTNVIYQHLQFTSCCISLSHFHRTDPYKILYMQKQHGCPSMCKVLKPTLCSNMNKIKWHFMNF